MRGPGWPRGRAGVDTPPTGISYETVVSAGTLVAAGALVAGDGPLPVGDAAAAGLVGPGFLLEHGISADAVPEIEVPSTSEYASILPSWPPEDDNSGSPSPDPAPATGGDSNDSTGGSGEQPSTPDSGGRATTDPAPSGDLPDPTSCNDQNDSTGSREEQQNTPDSGGVAGWP